jgi:hypothetical protein
MMAAAGPPFADRTDGLPQDPSATRRPQVRRFWRPATRLRDLTAASAERAANDAVDARFCPHCGPSAPR